MLWMKSPGNHNSDNYQEYLGKGHFINVPWIFTAFWYFVRSFLDELWVPTIVPLHMPCCSSNWLYACEYSTLAKLSLSGSTYIDTLLKDMPLESIPVRIGGKFELYNEAYEFDISEEGPLHCDATQGTLIPTSSSAASLLSYKDTAESATILSETRGVIQDHQPPVLTSSDVGGVSVPIISIRKESAPAIYEFDEDEASSGKDEMDIYKRSQPFNWLIIS